MSLHGVPIELLRDWQAVGHGANAKIGVLLVHGFTGSPASMRPWAEYLNRHGYTVSVPLLPGHGTKVEDLNLVKWQEWPAKAESELQSLLASCEKVFLIGFSMGGNISLKYLVQTSSTG